MKKSYPLRVDDSLFSKFQYVADKNHRSVAGHIAFLMECAIKEHEELYGEININLDNYDE